MAAPAASAPQKTLNQCIEFYLKERGLELASSSVQHYRWILLTFSEFVAATESEDFPAQRMDYDLIRSFFFWLSENRDYKPGTLAFFNSVIRNFSTWLHVEGTVDKNPAARLASPKKPKRLPYYLTDEQVERLVGACSADWKGQWARSILLTFLGTGMRVSELTGLDVHSVSLGSRLITVLGKRDKERTIPFDDPLAEVLERWLWLREGFSRADAMFVNIKGRRPCDHNIYFLVKSLGQKVGINEMRCSPHTLRHTFATNYLMGGGDIEVLQEILGHEDLNTTRIYAHVTKQRLRQNFKKADPLKKIQAAALNPESASGQLRFDF